MQTAWTVLRAMLYCPYKAWLLEKGNSDNSNKSVDEQKQERIELFGTKALVAIPVRKVNTDDKLAVAAWCSMQPEQSIEVAQISYISSELGNQPIHAASIRISSYSKKAQKLLADVKGILTKDEPPPFYRNSHCPECQFKDSCYKKLKERDCISLLPGMSTKVVARYHNKGISTITQLSHIFRPRRRNRRPKHAHGHYLWELKALAIREQKTFVISAPDIEKNSEEIYIDFEGLPDEGWVYLIGIIIKKDGEEDEHHSFWADAKEDELQIFQKLFTILNSKPDIPIYHYGSYESQALRKVSKKWPDIFKGELLEVERRLVNVLAFLHSHVYPPTYGNGLKEVAAFIGFQWQNPELDGVRSVKWRKQWEIDKESSMKNSLVQYNIDDCLALAEVCKWLMRFYNSKGQDGVQNVADMKKKSPYKFQSNEEFGDDFNVITKASYFDYQHSKIYWRNNRNRTSAEDLIKDADRHLGRGKQGWNPKKVNEVIVLPQLKACPKCGHKKLYSIRSQVFKWRQTDLKFTPTGIKRWVVEYQSTQVKCAKCRSNHNNGVVRRMLFGDNLFAWATNLYVAYHLSHEKISRLLEEQFGIWAFRQYFVDRQHKWWDKWQAEVDYLKEIILHSPVIHIDETTMRLSKDSGYVWVFATPHTVFYHFTLTREPDFLHDWLKDYKGIIVTDSYPGYETLKIKQQKCLVHLIRDLNDDLFANPFDDEYKEIVTAFGKLLRSIVETIDQYGLKKRHLLKHIKDTEKFSQQFLEKEYKSGLSIKCVKRLKKHWDQLWTFLHYDGVPWNNNNAEAAAKAFAQHRHGVKGRGSERGLQDFLKMLSLAQTCRYRQISFLDFLRHKVGIWENVSPEILPGFLPFGQARMYVRRLGFERKRELNKWKSEGKRPAFIPSSPNITYRKKGWLSWPDWVGFSFMSFEEARTYMRRLGLKNRPEYWQWRGSGKRPKTIPYSPEKEYKNAGWKDLGDYLGTGNEKPSKKERMNYAQSKLYIQAVCRQTNLDNC